MGSPKIKYVGWGREKGGLHASLKCADHVKLSNRSLGRAAKLLSKAILIMQLCSNNSEILPFLSDETKLFFLTFPYLQNYTRGEARKLSFPKSLLLYLYLYLYLSSNFHCEHHKMSSSIGHYRCSSNAF